MLSRLSRQLSSLSQLKSFSRISIDSGDLSKITPYSDLDVTTNPSLLLKAFKSEDCSKLLDEVLSPYKDSRITRPLMNEITDKLLAKFSKNLLNTTKGSLMLQLDPQLSFDTIATVKRANRLKEYFSEIDAPFSRVQLKIASTWEGIQACKILKETSDISCVMTLVFNKAQAIACAEAKADSIAPYVGRVTDWHKKNNEKEFKPSEEPGVKLVKEIVKYFSLYQPKTQVLAASLRNVGQVLELAGCDKLTLSPELIKELESSEFVVEDKVEIEEKPRQENKITQKKFRWLLNQDPLATEKLSEGIRVFSDDTAALHIFLRKYIKKLKKTVN